MKQNDVQIDVHNDALMIELGIHPRYDVPKDPSVWTKSPQEMKALKALRSKHKGKMHLGNIPTKIIPVQAKLIVQLKKNKHFPNSTYSVICYMHQIGDILNYFNQKDPVVAKYIYNGKTYKPNERPFWMVRV